MNLMGGDRGVGETMDYGACPNRKLKQLNQGDKKSCMLCGHNDSSEKTYGFLFQLDDILVHHFCIIFSTHSVQNGYDHEDLKGFLYDDIKSEIMRGAKETCFYCKKKGATISCSGRGCLKIFHLPCGLKNESMHQYYDEFKSFCKTHRVIPKIPEIQLSRAKVECPICMELVEPSTSPSSFWAPCCKQSWFHRECIQDLCLNSGYYLKCPFCNNKKEFRSRVLQLGILTPSRAASWEAEPNAYSELLPIPSTCNASICLCQYSDRRNHREFSGKWNILICCACGSNGTHAECSNLKYDQTSWICDVCRSVVNDLPACRLCPVVKYS